MSAIVKLEGQLTVWECKSMLM